MMTLPKLTTAPSAPNVAENAILVSLHFSSWGAKKSDKRLTAEVASNHNAAANMFDVRKELVLDGVLDELDLIRGRARKYHNSMTMPWNDDGTRVLPGTLYFTYCETMREFQTQWAIALDKFIEIYPSAKNEAKIRLNGAYNDADYPPEHKIRKKFAFDIDTDPIPEGNFKCRVIDQEIDKLNKNSVESFNRRVDRLNKESFNRLAATVKDSLERFRSRQNAEGTSDKKTFRDSAVDNIREIVELVGHFNVTGNKDIEEVLKRIKSDLCYYDAETLRTSPAALSKTADSAEDILKKLSDFI